MAVGIGSARIPNRRDDVYETLLETLRNYPELSIFLALAAGFLIGPRKLAGFSLGTVTATLLAGLLIGQLGVPITGPIKSTFFLLFLFAVGYGVGPQFFSGLSRDGPRQVVFAVLVLLLCLAVPVLCARLAGLDIGYAAGLYAGSQTISASIGVATDQIASLGLDPEKTKALTDAIPIGYAVTYVFGTIGTAILLANIGPKLLGIDLVQACKDYENRMGARDDIDHGQMSAYHQIETRAFLIEANSPAIGRHAAEILPDSRIVIERVRRDGEIFDAQPETILQENDVVAISGPRNILVETVSTHAREVDDRLLLSYPMSSVSVFVTNREVDGKTIEELAHMPAARGVYLSRIQRHLVDIPILPMTQIHRADVMTLTGPKMHVDAAVKKLGYADQPIESTDIMTVALCILVGALLGTLSISVGGVPISLSTSGGALLAGLVLGYLRAIHPTFGRVPGPALSLMNTLGLNVFIAIVGINAGPGFVAGLQEVGWSLLVWGMVATTVPMVAAIYLGRYVFRFDPAILFGICAGVRTTTAAIGMIQEAARSKVPALGYGMPYAIGNTLLTLSGLFVVLLMQ